MVHDKFERQIKESLQNGTEPAVGMKDDIWQKINARMEQEAMHNGNQTITQRPKRKKKTGKIMMAIASLAAAMLLIFIVVAPEPSQALMKQIKQWFVPEKVVIQELEGTPSETDVSVHEGRMGYVIYFDKEMYKMIQKDGKDRIVLINPPGEPYPEVYMEIGEHKGSAEAVIKEIHGQLGDYPRLLDVKKVNEPIQGWEVHAVGGTGGLEWDDPVVHYYVFDNTIGGSFVVKQQYFLEAAEGHGARLKHMLKEFHILNPNEENKAVVEEVDLISSIKDKMKLQLTIEDVKALFGEPTAVADPNQFLQWRYDFVQGNYKYDEKVISIDTEGIMNGKMKAQLVVEYGEDTIVDAYSIYYVKDEEILQYRLSEEGELEQSASAD